MINKRRIFVNLIVAFVLTFPFPSSLWSETRDQYFSHVECATAFLKTSIIFRARKAIGDGVEGQPITLQVIDFWEQRSAKIANFLFTESSFQSEAKADLSIEMDSFLAVFENDMSGEVAIEIEHRAIVQALKCDKDYIAAGWFN